MAILNVLLCHRHSPMNVGIFFRYAFKQAGCRVRTMGPVEDTVYGHHFPADDWEQPDFPLGISETMEAVRAVELATTGGFKPDLLVMCDQYDAFFLTGESPIPFVWIAVENWNQDQLDRYNQRRGAIEFYMIRHLKDHNTPLPLTSEFLPFGFDPYIQPLLGLNRDKKCVQVGTHYQPRPYVWNLLRQSLDGAPGCGDEEYGAGLQESASTLFGKTFSYAGMANVYNRGIVTISASNCDFLPMRVFEAMGMGAVLVSDDQPIIREWCGPPSKAPDLGIWFAHDGSPEGIVRTVQEVLALPPEAVQYITSTAYTYAISRHTYAHRARRILARAGIQGATRMVTD